MKIGPSQFLRLSRGKTLILTTYRLEGDVLYELLLQSLGNEPWPKQVIVLAEKARISRAAFLEERLRTRHDCRLAVIRCKVQKALQTNTLCPVFHSKLWLIYRNRQVEAFAVTSLNLSRVHLEKSTPYHETFFATQRNISPTMAREFQKTFLGDRAVDKIKKHAAISLPPGLHVVEKQAAGWALRTATPPHSLLGGGTWRAAAPLVSHFALPHCEIFYSSSAAKKIHAKIYQGENSLLLGSPNITHHAWRPWNHECTIAFRGRSRRNWFQRLHRIHKEQQAETNLDPDFNLELSSYEEEAAYTCNFVRAQCRGAKLFITLQLEPPWLASRVSFLQLGESTVRFRKVSNSRTGTLTLSCFWDEWAEGPILNPSQVKAHAFTAQGKPLFSEDLYFGSDVYLRANQEPVRKKKKRKEKPGGAPPGDGSASAEDVRYLRANKLADPTSDGRDLLLLRESGKEVPTWVERVARIAREVADG